MLSNPLQRLAVVLLVGLFGSNLALGAEPKSVAGLKNPDSVAIGPGGKIYVTQMGISGKAGDGSVVIVNDSGKITTFAAGLDDPKGLLVVGDTLYVADIKRIWKIDAKGKAEVFLKPDAFPRPPVYLNDLTADGLGNLYVSDSGDRAGKLGAIFRIDSRKQVTMLINGELSEPPIDVPYGILVDDDDHIFVGDFGLGDLYRFDMNTQNAQRIGGGFGGLDGLARDLDGRLFVSDRTNGRLYQINSDLEPPSLLSERFKAPADLAFTADGKFLLVLDTTAGSLTWFPTP